MENDTISQDVKVIIQGRIATLKEKKYSRWCGVPISITPTISLEDTIKFVNSVVDTCVNEENGEVMPEIVPIATWCAVIEYYTDFPLPDSIEDSNILAFDSSLDGAIYPNINTDQLNSIIKSIDDRLDYIKKSNEEMIKHQLNDLTNVMKPMTEKFSEALSDVSSQDIEDFLKGFSGESFNKNVVELYKNGNISNK